MLRKNNIPGLDALFQADPGRAGAMLLDHGGWRLDFAGVPIERDGWQRRQAGAGKGFSAALDSLFSGAIVNPSEGRPALHMALRAAQPQAFLDQSAAEQLLAGRRAMQTLAGALHSGTSPGQGPAIRDLIHIGIGGSDLGPRLVAEALDGGDAALRVHWLTTLDGRRIERLLASLDPAATGLVIASKSFTTGETLLQAGAVRDWLGPDWTRRCWAATARPDRAGEFGVDASCVFEFPDWVGGRFSLWSAVGLSAAARIGPERWQRLLAGAGAADSALRSAPPDQSLAGVLALLMDCLRRELDFPTLGVVSYEPRLGLLAEYLQQLVMESLGKQVTGDDRPVDAPTAPLVFGGRGTDLQHSIFQALHQGSQRHPMLLVASCRGGHDYDRWQREQLAHLLAQATALSRGRHDGPVYARSPGGNPVMLLVADELTPEALGWLLASFEHAVYLLGSLWNINPFDQWGVEQGKRLAGDYRRILDAAPDQAGAPDPGLAGLVDWIRKRF